MKKVVSLLIILLALSSCQLTSNTPVHNPVSTSLERTVQVREVCDGNVKSWGTGVVLGDSAKGTLIVTAYHVAKPLSTCRLETNDYAGIKIVIADKKKDLAILISSTHTTIKTVLVDPVIGEHIYAIGYPNPIIQKGAIVAVTDGLVVSYYDEQELHRTSAPVYFGNSGGGVWNNKGQLVGIVLATIPQLDGYSFFISSSEVKKLLEQI